MTKYQIAILPDGPEVCSGILKDTLKRHLAELGVDASQVLFLEPSALASRDRKAPTVGVYFGLAAPPVTWPGLSDFVQDGNIIVPVVQDLDIYNTLVPDELRGINGVSMSAMDPGLEAVASVVLEGLSLLRRTRRLFISYRRVETRSVAIQLYELFDASGFDVFLDTHSVRPGEPFQEILWHRLADTDVICVLDSPDFMASRWTEEELARANASSVQVLQLVWPDQMVPSTAAFSRLIQVEAMDFESTSSTGPDARLSDSFAASLVPEVESLRARALSARHSYLVQELCRDAVTLGLSAKVQPERFITIDSTGHDLVAAVPTVGVPDAVCIQEIEASLDLKSRGRTSVVLLYDERGIRKKWLEHLDWLNGQALTLRSVRVADAPNWLRNLK